MGIIKKVKIQNSKNNNLIQLADMVSGSVYRGFTAKDDREIYRKLLGTKVKKITIQAPKGRPLLHWVNKHPLEYVTGFPTQLTEVFDPQKKDKFPETPKYGELEKNWHNLLFHGDNKEVLKLVRSRCSFNTAYNED